MLGTLLLIRRGYAPSPEQYGKCAGGQGVNASLLPHQDVNAVLAVAGMYVDGTPCSALMIWVACDQLWM